MERGYESGNWNASPEGDANSSDEKSKSAKSKSNKEAVAKTPEAPATASNPERVGTLLQAMGGEVLKTPELKLFGNNVGAEQAKAEQKPEDTKAETTVEQDRHLAANIAELAVKENRDAMARETNTIELASGETVGETLVTMENTLEAPGLEPPEQVIQEVTDTAVEELARADELHDVAAPGEQNPLDWPNYDPLNSAHAAEMNPDDPTVPPAVGTGGAAGQPPRGYAAPGMAPGSGFGYNSGPLATGNAANTLGSQRRGRNGRGNLLTGLFAGAVGGWFFGRRSGRQNEQRQSRQALREQAAVFQEKATRYEQQISQSEERVRNAARQHEQLIRRAGEATPAMAVGASALLAEQVSRGAASTEIKVNAPKPVDQMTNAEVLEAAAHITVGNKSLRELVELDHEITKEDLRDVLKAARNGNNVERQFRIEQAYKRAQLRYEIDPMLAHQSSTEETAPRSGQDAGSDALPSFSEAPGQREESSPAATGLSGASAGKPAMSTGIDRPAPHGLIIANIVALAVLGVLLVVVLVVWLMHQV